MLKDEESSLLQEPSHGNFCNIGSAEHFTVDLSNPTPINPPNFVINQIVVDEDFQAKSMASQVQVFCTVLSEILLPGVARVGNL